MSHPNLMFIPASSEFVALCQAQVSVLTQGLGATLSAVYLTEELVEGTQAKLIPVVVYPESTVVWEEDDNKWVLPDRLGTVDTIPRLLNGTPRLLPQISDPDQDVGEASADWDEELFRRQRQIVLPLMQEGVVLGLLVTGREDRPWSESEQATIERIARTLTIAYILERRRTWVEQQLTQTKLEEAQRRDRLDDLLHQFRNPLTALRTFGKLLLKRLLPGDKNREVASSIVRETERLQELLQQFDACLDSSQDELTPLTLPAATVIEASQPGSTPGGLPLLSGKNLTLEAISVTDVLEPLTVSAQAIAQERELDLQADIPSNLPLVQGNAVALREVLSNLIDNALKYTPTGEHIDIRAGEKRQTPEGEQLGIAISDTGPGIPLQDLEHLFERHYRGVQASTAIPGSGLGLAIAKELIEQMHGEIEVFSPAKLVWAKHHENQDDLVKGTTFMVWLSISGIDFMNSDEL